MSRNLLAADLAAAVVLALVVIVASPGPAVDGIIGCVVLLIVGVGTLVGRRRERRRTAGLRTLTAAERSAQRRASRARSGRR